MRFLKTLLSALCVSLTISALSGVQTDTSITFSLTAETQDFATSLLPLVPSTFVLAELSVSADVCCDIDEIRSFFCGAQTPDDLAQAFILVAHKHRFSLARCMFSLEGKSLYLRIELEGLWTFEKLKLTGSLVGKERYRQFYTIDPGEPFRHEQHVHALERIKNALADDGYMQAIIQDIQDKDYNTKTVTVSLCIEPHKRFEIGSVTLSLGLDQSFCLTDCLSFQKKLQSMISRALKGSYYSKDLVREELDRIDGYLSAKGYFGRTITVDKKIDYVREKVDIDVTLEIKHKRIYEFLGNLFFKKNELLEMALPFGDSVLLPPPSLIADEIKSAYKRRGFWDVAITWQEDGDRVFFSIVEGCRARLKNVELLGNTAGILVTPLEHYFGHIIKAGYCEADVIQSAIAQLIFDYAKNGFWFVRVTNQEFVAQEDGSYCLKLTLEEGERRMLHKITAEPFFDFDGSCVLEPYGSFEPCPFDQELLGRQQQALRAWLYNHGYLYVKPVYELHRDDCGYTVCWKFQGSTEQVVFGDTVIIGAPRLPSWLLKRELTYKPGDVWDMKKIDRSLVRLRSLGIFESLSLYPYHMTSSEPRKTMLLKCVLDDPYEVRVRAGMQLIGYNLQFRGATFKLGGSFVWKNPTNRADILKFDGDITRYIRDIQLKYSVPWLGNTPVRTECKAYSVRFDQPLFPGSKQTLYSATQDGFLCTIRKDWENWHIGFDGGFEWMGLEQLSLRAARAIYFDPAMIPQKTPFFFMEQTFIADYLDNDLNPTCGGRALASCKMMIPMQRPGAFFAKLLGEYALFFPVQPCIVAGLRVRFGHIFNKCFNEILPSERFYLGGVHSLRGYEPDLAPPLNLLECNGCCYPVALGGKTMGNLNMELRFPLYGALGGVLFSDFGVLVQDHFSEIIGRNVLAATGFGLRYNTPVGPLSFDIGWNWRKDACLDRQFAWFLTLGHAF